jgi:hypothetical protein
MVAAPRCVGGVAAHGRRAVAVTFAALLSHRSITKIRYSPATSTSSRRRKFSSWSPSCGASRATVGGGSAHSTLPRRPPSRPRRARRQPFAEGLLLRTSTGPRFQPQPKKWRSKRFSIADESSAIPFMRITETHGDSVVTLPADSQVRAEQSA